MPAVGAFTQRLNRIVPPVRSLKKPIIFYLLNPGAECVQWENELLEAFPYNKRRTRGRKNHLCIKENGEVRDSRSSVCRVIAEPIPIPPWLDTRNLN